MKKLILISLIFFAIPFVISENFATIQWDAPTVNENNKPLKDLEGFFVYVSNIEFSAVPGDITYETCLSMENCYYVPKHDRDDYSLTIPNLPNDKFFVQVLAVDQKWNYIDSNPPPQSLPMPEIFHTELIWPVRNPMPRITSCYGWRILHTGPNWHDGIDIGLPVGEDILAVADGIVIRTCFDDQNYWPPSECNPRRCGCRGGFIEMYHPHLGTYSQYNHLSAVKVSKDDHVMQGQVIALSGNTGISSGPHLDFKYFFSSNFARRVDNPIGNPLCYLPPIDYVLAGQSCFDAPDSEGWISGCMG